jgi:hypothetical protein
LAEQGQVADAKTLEREACSEPTPGAEHLVPSPEAARAAALRHGPRNHPSLGGMGAMTDTKPPSGPVELARRGSNGLEVALNWSRGSGRVWIVILYVATGVSIELDADPANALDYYYHPFAYCLAEATTPDHELAAAG